MSIPEFETGLVFHAPRSMPVLNICEQVALDPNCTRRISRELGVDHPAIPAGDVVMSTDLVVTERVEFGQRRRAIAVKREQDLSRRVLEKLAIERRYWRERNTLWTLQLDTHLPRVLVDNMLLLHPWHDVDRVGCAESELPLVRAWIVPHLEGGVPLSLACAKCDTALGLDSGTSLGAAYHLIAHQKIAVDLNVPLQAGAGAGFTVAV